MGTLKVKKRKRSRAIDEPYPILLDDGSVEEGPSFLDMQEGLINNSLDRDNDNRWKKELLFLIDAWRVWGTSLPESNDRVYKIIKRCLFEATDAQLNDLEFKLNVKESMVRGEPTEFYGVGRIKSKV